MPGNRAQPQASASPPHCEADQPVPANALPSSRQTAIPYPSGVAHAAPDAPLSTSSLTALPGGPLLQSLRLRCGWRSTIALKQALRGLFDNLPHDLLLKAVRKHVKCKWALLYIERWLTAPMVKDGVTIERTRGTPQGGVISPILSNLFLHYAFDLWMGRTHPDIPWCRYADDGLVHCRTEQEAQAVMADLQARLAACGLEMHPTKTKIVYCKDNNRKGNYPNVSFDFLGYCFRPRRAENARTKQVFCNFLPAISRSALESMRATVRDLDIRRQTHVSMDDIARQLNPLLRGWIEYYGRYMPSALGPFLQYVNQTLQAWVMRKFKSLKGHKTRARLFLTRLAGECPGFFAHWKPGRTGSFA